MQIQFAGTTYFGVERLRAYYRLLGHLQMLGIDRECTFTISDRTKISALMRGITLRSVSSAGVSLSLLDDRRYLPFNGLLRVDARDWDQSRLFTELTDAIVGRWKPKEVEYARSKRSPIDATLLVAVLGEDLAIRQLLTLRKK